MDSAQPSSSPEEMLKRILAALENEDSKVRLAAIQDLGEQSYSSPAILRTLETLAIHDKSKPVRTAAREALDTSAHKFIQSRLNKLGKRERGFILKEIHQWFEDGLIQEDVADVLSQRYDFDDKPTVQPVKLQSAPVPSTQSTSEPQPAPPRPTLTQTLLSETSIKIALYLGAFFVIAAAAILAAAVEEARIPILFFATLLFLGGALALKKRLPQPSFALFVVFSFLLPTDANVLADVLHLSSKASAGYWFFVMGLIAVIWGFGTWLYASRIFSMAAFIALVISVSRLSEWILDEPEIYLILLSLTNLLALAGISLLRRWKDSKFSLPLFVLTQIGQGLLLLFAIIVVFERGKVSLWHLIPTLFWFISAAFYFFSNLLYPFLLFPWIAVATLLPVPLTFVFAFNSKSPEYFALALWLWGLIQVAASEGARLLNIEKIKQYSAPWLVGSILLFLSGNLVGLLKNETFSFFMLFATAIVFTAVQFIKPRWYIWTVSLLAGLAAYFMFFSLPFMKAVEIFTGYQFLIVSLVMLVPDLLAHPDLSDKVDWRWPPRILGVILASLTYLIFNPAVAGEPGNSAIIYVTLAVFAALYTLKYQLPWLGYLGTASAAFAVAFALDHFNVDAWLPALTGLAFIYYFAGFFLSTREHAMKWGQMLRYSGLALTGLISLVALSLLKETGGWYALVAAALFVTEMFSRKNSWFEIGAQIFGSVSLYLILHDFDVDTRYQLFAISLLWLGTDIAFAKVYRNKRSLEWPVRIIGAILVGITTVWLKLTGLEEPNIAVICFTTYTVFLLVYALLYRQALLFYGFTSYSMLALIYAIPPVDSQAWLLPVLGLGTLYYILGFILRQSNPENKWAFVFWTSGLGIGVFTSVLAPFKGGLDSAIAPAITATMVAVEAFQRRNVWLGFPANALYLMAYFMILVELNVDEPQFFSVATAALGVLMHYLLTRAGSKTGAFITGMVSQLVLLGTTYIQFVSNERLVFFAVLFFQALAVLVYGIVIRSRSLVITPIIIVVIAVMTVLFGLMQGIGTILMIGCTGILLLLLGIAAVILRERIKQIGDRFSDWQA